MFRSLNAFMAGTHKNTGGKRNKKIIFATPLEKSETANGK